MRELTKKEQSNVSGGFPILGAVAVTFIAGVIVGYASEKYKQYQSTKETKQAGCEPTC